MSRSRPGIQHQVACANDKLAAAWHGVARIHNKVEERRAKLRGIDFARPCNWVQEEIDFDSLAEHPSGQDIKFVD
jgi:hypothetical protein